MALVQSNYRGVTKKMTVTSLLILAYGAGNISGPHFFRKSEDPQYETAFKAIMISYSLAMVCAFFLRIYLRWLNAKRIKEEGILGSAELAGFVDANSAGALRHTGTLLDDEDLTDWQTVGFRYRL
jgi:hypothetical protein